MFGMLDVGEGMVNVQTLMIQTCIVLKSGCCENHDLVSICDLEVANLLQFKPDINGDNKLP